MTFSRDDLIRITRRWWWLLVLAPLLGAGAMYLFSTSQQPLYRATAVLRIQLTPGSDGVDASMIEASLDLAETYRHLATMAPILSPVIDDLGLPDTLEELRERLSVSVVRNTQLLEVTATDPNPEHAAAIADAVARRFTGTVGHLGADTASSTPTTPGAVTGDGVIVSVVPAEVPGEPFAPRTTLFVLLGVVFGLGIAVAMVGVAVLLGKTGKPNPELSASPRGLRSRSREKDEHDDSQSRHRVGATQLDELQAAQREATTAREALDGHHVWRRNNASRSNADEAESRSLSQ